MDTGEPKPQASVGGVVAESTSVLSDAPPSDATPAGVSTAAHQSKQVMMHSVWASGYEQWRDVKLKDQLTSRWDGAFASIVQFKEGTASEKHRLVSTVKEFAASYKAEPTSDKVEGLLKFFKRFISLLFERVEVSEGHFLSMYQSISMAPDPAPLLLAAHLEITNLVGKVRNLQHEVAAKVQELTKLSRIHEDAVRSALSGSDPGSEPLDDQLTSSGTQNEGEGQQGMSAGSAMKMLSREMVELRQQAELSRNEKRELVQIIRDAELEQQLLRQEISRLMDEKRAMAQQLLHSQNRYEDLAARSERDTSALLIEIEEAHDREIAATQQLRVASGGSGQPTDAVVRALEAELDEVRANLRAATTELSQLQEDRHSSKGGHSHPHHASSDGQAHNAPQEHDAATAAVMKGFQAELRDARRERDEAVASQAAERRLRRAAESALEHLQDEHRTSLVRIKELEEMTKMAVPLMPLSLPLQEPQPTADGKVTAADSPATTAEMLQQLLQPSPSSTAELVEGPSDDRMSSPRDTSDSTLISALTHQRDLLKKRASEWEWKATSLEQQLREAHHQLRHRTGTSDDAASRDPSSSSLVSQLLGDGDRFRSVLMASVAAASADHGNVIRVVSGPSSTAAEGGAAVTAATTKRKRRLLQQTVRKAADGVAVVVANMITHSATTRTVLMLYLMGLHIVIMLVTYYLAFRGSSCNSAGHSRLALPSRMPL